MASSSSSGSVIIQDWCLRPPASNDELLRAAFLAVLAESADAPPERKLIMYDACDGEVRAPLGPFRKRLDARRGTKPKKSEDQRLVCTPFDANKFHFGKISNEKERLVKLILGSASRYDILTNKFPLFPKHMLLVAGALVPQQMTETHLGAIAELLQATTGFCAYFNSWCASASVNHFHVHLIDEFPPVTQLPLVLGPYVGGTRCLQPHGFPGFCYVVPIAAVGLVDQLVTAMQADNQPHNLLFTPRHVYVFPKPHVRPPRSFELYPETVGGPELIGSFTVYQQHDFDVLMPEHAAALCRMNTAPLPSRILQAGVSFDDSALRATATTTAAMPAALPMERGKSSDSLPRFPAPNLHAETWPQDRPIARALANNVTIN